MENGVVIGLCGYAGVGKDCAAQGLLGIGYHRIAFADGIRELARMIDPLVTMAGGSRLDSLVHGIGWDEAKKNPDVRRLLQTIGNGVREVIGENAWVGVADDKIWEAKKAGKRVVVTDVRFPNEVQAVYESGATLGYTSAIVRITRPGVGPVNNHISETAIDSIEADFEIVNDGTPEELQAKLVAYAESLTEARVEG
jgi:hypothetical protein